MSDIQDQNEKWQKKGGPKAVPANQCALGPSWLVQSCKGRDEGKFYMVLAKDADGFVLVTDGAKRPLSRPKRKNPKHLLAWGLSSSVVAKQLRSGKKVTDAQIREILLQIAERVDTVKVAR